MARVQRPSRHDPRDGSQGPASGAPEHAKRDAVSRSTVPVGARTVGAGRSSHNQLQLTLPCLDYPGSVGEGPVMGNRGIAADRSIMLNTEPLSVAIQQAF